MKERKIAVTGSSGFIGSNFIKYNIDKYKNLICFSNSSRNNLKRVINSNSKNIIYKNFSEFEKYLPSANVLFHTAYDNTNILNNLRFIDVIEKVLKKKNNLDHIIILGTISLFNFNNVKHIDENTTENIYQNDYYLIKKIIVNKIKNLRIKYSKIKFTIIHPSLVYGVNSNWSNILFNNLSHKYFYHPGTKYNLCNCIYIKDFLKQLNIIINLKKPQVDEILLSGNNNTTWKDLYLLHQEIINKINNKKVLRDCVIRLDNKEYNFHSNMYFSYIMHIIFKFILANKIALIPLLIVKKIINRKKNKGLDLTKVKIKNSKKFFNGFQRNYLLSNFEIKSVFQNELKNKFQVSKFNEIKKDMINELQL